MTDTAAGWQAIPVGPLVTGELDDDVVVVHRSWLRRNRLKTVLWSILAMVAVAAVLAWVFALQIVALDSAAMEPTLDRSDQIVINRLDTNPQRGQIVVHRGPDGTLFAQRVIAFEGETVTILNGVITVDQAMVIEPYLDDRIINDDFAAYTVPTGTVFVLGDNRQEAMDSRLMGAVDTDTIVGTMVWQVPSQP
ncbi:MAG: signal peptidase I [Actinomycetota bacterium]